MEAEEQRRIQEKQITGNLVGWVKVDTRGLTKMDTRDAAVIKDTEMDTMEATTSGTKPEMAVTEAVKEYTATEMAEI